MSGSGPPTVHVIAGPNGAGKSTFYETVVRPTTDAPFVNADLIQRDELVDPSPEAAYKAAEIARARRAEHVTARRSFVFESVFSHEAKLAELRAAKAGGFRLVVFHLMLQSADLAVARVAERRRLGGHDVPEAKVR